MPLLIRLPARALPCARSPVGYDPPSIERADSTISCVRHSPAPRDIAFDVTAAPF